MYEPDELEDGLINGDFVLCAECGEPIDYYESKAHGGLCHNCSEEFWESVEDLGDDEERE